MSNKGVTAADRVRTELDGLLADVDRNRGEALEEVARLSVRLVLQAALEAEVAESWAVSATAVVSVPRRTAQRLQPYDPEDDGPAGPP